MKTSAFKIQDFIEKKADGYEATITIKSRFIKGYRSLDPFSNTVKTLEGNTFSYIPHSNDPATAFERLKNLYSQRASEKLQELFQEKYPIVNLTLIDEEIASLENFIADSKKESRKIAFFTADKENYYNLVLTEEVRDHQEYLRLTEGYYLNRPVSLSDIRPSFVFGKYVLYLEWLKNIRTEYLKHGTPEAIQRNNEIEEIIADHLSDLEDKLSMEQDQKLKEALYLFFLSEDIPKEPLQIKFKVKVNKKKVGWVLHNIYREIRQEKLSAIYLSFAKKNIVLFNNDSLYPTNLQGSRLYKYFTTNPD